MGPDASIDTQGCRSLEVPSVSVKQKDEFEKKKLRLVMHKTFRLGCYPSFSILTG